MNAMVKTLKASVVLAGLVLSGTLFAAGSETAPSEARSLPELVGGKAAIEAREW